MLHAQSFAFSADQPIPRGPLGVGQGIYPGRVVWIHDPKVVSWGRGFWWEPENFDSPRIAAMIKKGLLSLTGASDVKEAWNKLFVSFNQKKFGEARGYKSGEKIIIKINFNGQGWSNSNSLDTNKAITNPTVLREFLRSLIVDGGIPAKNITIFDASRNIPDSYRAMVCQGEVKEICIEDKNSCQRDQKWPIEWSEDFGGEASYLPTCLTAAKYMINCCDLKGHSMNGVTLSAKNHFGSYLNSDSIAPPIPAGLHRFAAPMTSISYTAFVDLSSHPHLGGKTMLYFMDGLVGAITESTSITASRGRCVFEMSPFNGSSPSSLFFSQDPVAIDSVAADILVNEPFMKKNNRHIADSGEACSNYLIEEALADNPPSKTKYRFTKTSLGVYEHWNNSTDKKYSRNLGKDEGIELIAIEM